MKIGAKIALAILVILVLALVGYVGYTVYRKRKEAQNKKWYQFNRQVDEDPYGLDAVVSGFKKAAQTG